MSAPNSADFSKSVARVVIPAALLIIATLVFEFASAAAYVYPELDLGQSGFALVLLAATWIATAIFSIICLWKKRVVTSLLILSALAAPILLSNVVDRAYWKFSNNKSEYLRQIDRETGSSPKYKIFDWGNRNTSLGGGVEFEAVVFDEMDDLVRPARLRSPDWRGNPGLALPHERWIAAEPPDCKRQIKSFGEHFYYVVQAC
jgi:hypothetical protein